MTAELPQEQWVWVPFEVDKLFDGYRIDRFLAQRLHSYSRHKVQKILEEARVMKEGRLVRASSKVRTGDKIQVAYLRQPEEPLSANATLPVLYEDDDLLIINKPSGLLSHPTDKVVSHTVLGVLRHCRPDIGKLFLLHRLDRETSGVLALGKHAEAARLWTRSMEAHQMQKEYIALVHGTLSAEQGTLDWPIGREGGEVHIRQWVHVPGAASAVTHYQTLYRDASRSIVRVFPKTGRLHQIRVHFAALGHPLLGDYLYHGQGELYLKMISEGLDANDRRLLGAERVALHAQKLSFIHPMTRQPLTIEAVVPEDMTLLAPPGILINCLSDEKATVRKTGRLVEL
jgi:23S rRNA pseudouridine1911/1915/1917 synthase